MGLFDINMPLLYGEGSKAFTRLQHEIMKNSDDESIFAWTDSSLNFSGMFAQSPAAFANSGDVVAREFEVFHRPEPNTVTSRGLSMQLVGEFEVENILGSWMEWVPLHCSLGKKGSPLMIKICFFSRLGHYYRYLPGALMDYDGTKFRIGGVRKIYLYC